MRHKPQFHVLEHQLPRTRLIVEHPGTQRYVSCLVLALEASLASAHVNREVQNIPLAVVEAAPPVPTRLVCRVVLRENHRTVGIGRNLRVVPFGKVDDLAGLGQENGVAVLLIVLASAKCGERRMVELVRYVSH